MLNERETFFIEGYELRELNDEKFIILNDFLPTANDIKEYRRRYYKKKYRTNEKFNISVRIAGAIGRSLKGNKAGRHWETLVGYTVNDLKRHLKRTVPKEYTWQNFLKGKLHIDHIIPIVVFNYTKPEHMDFQRCWALSNLRLLPAKENLIKHKKLFKPFQPSLKLE